MITYERTGGRKIELFLPFEFMGRKIDAINLAPVKFDNVLRWQEGKITSILTLMSMLSGLEEEILRELRYPDADRVMAIFIDMLPPEIRDTITQTTEMLDAHTESKQQINGQGVNIPDQTTEQQPDDDVLGLGLEPQ